MSAFMNGGSSDNGGASGSNSISNALSNAFGSGSAGQSGFGKAFQAGDSSVGGDSYQFQLPSDVANATAGGTGTDATAGLSGVQSGMTMPNFSNAMTGSGDYSFTMPDNKNALGNIAAAGAKMGQQLQQQQKPQSGGSGRVSMRAQDFTAPVIALPMASGSNAGQSLLQMMQRYQPGNTVGTNTGSGYGMR